MNLPISCRWFCCTSSKYTWGKYRVKKRTKDTYQYSFAGLDPSFSNRQNQIQLKTALANLEKDTIPPKTATQSRLEEKGLWHITRPRHLSQRKARKGRMYRTGAKALADPWTDFTSHSWRGTTALPKTARRELSIIQGSFDRFSICRISHAWDMLLRIKRQPYALPRIVRGCRLRMWAHPNTRETLELIQSSFSISSHI